MAKNILLSNNKLKEIKIKTIDILQTSSAHGIQNIIRSKNTIIIWMWSFFLVISTCTGSYFVIKSTLDYLKYHTVTTISIINEQKTQFPTVTFCGYPNINASLNETVKKIRFENIYYTDISNKSKYFEEFTDLFGIKCFSFNSGKNVYNKTFDLLNASIGGLINSLRLDLYLDVPDGFDYAELQIYIHNQSSPTYDIYNNGFWVKTGSWNYYEIEKVYHEQLSEPYNDCLKDVSEFKMNKTIINQLLQSNRKYLQTECFLFCSRLYAIEESNCGCQSSLLEFEKECVRKLSDKDLMNDSKKCVANYLKGFQNEMLNEKCRKYCPLECDSLSYSITQYLGLINDKGKISKVRKEGSYGLEFDNYEELNKHFVGILVYFKDLKYTLIRQEPKTQMFDFISNIGGILGLFLGISFLSFIEIFEILIENLFILYKIRA